MGKRSIGVLPVVLLALVGLDHLRAEGRENLFLKTRESRELFQRTLGMRPVGGNRTELLIEGPEFFPRRLEMIRNAKRTIDISTFLWCDDESGLAVAQALVDATQRGVRVRPIVDFFNIYPHDQVYGMLARAGAPVLVYNPPNWGLDRITEHALHEKVMVVDGKSVLTGGANLCNEYMIGGVRKLWRDMEVYFEGPLVEVVQSRYDDTWNWMAKTDYRVSKMATRRAADPFGTPFPRMRYRIYKEKTPVDVAPKGNDDGLYFLQQSYRNAKQGSQLKRALVELFDRAQESIKIYTPYYVPPSELEDALIRASKRGVKVTVITNSPETNDAEPARYAAIRHYRKSINGGVEIRQYLPVMMHVKGLMVDDTILHMGSHNLTHRSFEINGEIGVFLDNPEIAQRFAQAWEYDLTQSEEVTYLTLEKLQHSIKGILKTLLFGAFEEQI